MSPTPKPTDRRSQYPPRGSLLARALRHTVVATAVSLLLGALGCASASPGATVAPTAPIETPAEPPSPAEEQPTEPFEEWVRLPVQILFWLRRHYLDDSDRAMIREVQMALEQRTDVLRIRVAGHVYLDRESEAGLALARANAVIDYMTDELGMPRDLFEAMDGGDGSMWSEAADPDTNQFRRVEFSMLVRRAR